MQDMIKHFREVELGGRLFSASYGSAPTAPEVIAWFSEVLGFPAVDGYGSTEGGMMMLDNKIQKRCAAPLLCLWKTCGCCLGPVMSSPRRHVLSFFWSESTPLA
jgi:hypothetical protein